MFFSSLNLRRKIKAKVGSPSLPIESNSIRIDSNRYSPTASGSSNAPVDLKYTFRGNVHRLLKGTESMGNCCTAPAERPEARQGGYPAVLEFHQPEGVVEPMPPPPLLRGEAVQDGPRENGEQARVEGGVRVQEDEGGEGELDFETAVVMLMSHFPEASADQAGAYLAAAMEEEGKWISLTGALKKAVHEMSEEGFMDGEGAKEEGGSGVEEVDPFFLLHDAGDWRDGAELPAGPATEPWQDAPWLHDFVRGTEGEGVEAMDLSDPFSVANVPGGRQREYQAGVVQKLAEEFPRVGMSDIRTAMRGNNMRLGATHKALKAAVDQALVEERGGGVHGAASEGVKLMKRRRCRRDVPLTLPCDLVEAEWEVVLRHYALVQDEADLQLAQEMEEEEAAIEAQQIECGCCYGDFSFEEMAQCADGHLFCFRCLQRRVEESIFGSSQAKASLPCMDTNGCTEVFPPSEMRRALPGATLDRYEQRQAEESVAQAQLENANLVACPYCHLHVEMDEGQKVLACPNTDCGKESCRLCKGTNHAPLHCDEVEKKEETDVRKQVEELMSKALIRVCFKCRTEVLKNDGCNKVTCRCGQKMCYVCRIKVEDYSHFCSHTTAAGKPCRLCRKCSLWVNEDENLVVENARKRALVTLKLTEEQYAVAVKRGVGIAEKRMRKT